MSNIVSLAKARKRKKQAQKRQRADENRFAFGRTKAEKLAAKRAKEKQDTHLDGHRLKPDDS